MISSFWAAIGILAMFDYDCDPLRFGSSYCNMAITQSLDLESSEAASLDYHLEDFYLALERQLKGVVPTSSMASPGFNMGLDSDSPRR